MGSRNGSPSLLDPLYLLVEQPLAHLLDLQAYSVTDGIFPKVGFEEHCGKVSP
jgi:hypothetical protein